LTPPPTHAILASTLGCVARCLTRKHSIIFVAQTDKEFLWTWARDLQDAHGVKVDPDHILSVLVSQLRALKAQGTLYPEISEVEARALAIARKEWQESVEMIAAHAQEQEQARQDQRQREYLKGLARHVRAGRKLKEAA
jgi:hypothetical protein